MDSEKEKEVLTYVKNEVKNNNFHSYKELNNLFGLHYRKITLKEIYPRLGISLLSLPFKRPQNSLEEVRKELIGYVQKEVAKNHYPSRRYIEQTFRLRLTPDLFGSIEDLYQKAGLHYVQNNSQELKNKKAELLTMVVVSILPKIGLQLIESRGVHDRGVDLLTKDAQGNLIGVEIKAHNKYEPIKKRNIDQLKRFLKEEKIKNVVLVTTASKFETNLGLSPNMIVVTYDNLKKFCSNTQLKTLQFIRNESVHQETEERNIKREHIIKCIQKRAALGKDTTYEDISRTLHLDLYSYFKDIYEAFEAAKISNMLKRVKIGKGKSSALNRESLINEILKYIKEECIKGKYPTGRDVERKFGIRHIWNYVTMIELYHRLVLTPYHKRKQRMFH